VAGVVWACSAVGCSSSDGVKGAAGGPGDDNSACSSCGSSKCKTSKDKCTGLPACNQLMTCLLDCSATDVSCRAGCANAQIDTTAAAAAAELLTCLTQSCTAECFSSGGGGGDLGGAGNAGGADAHGGSGGTTSGGASSVAGSGAAGAPVRYHCAGTATVASCSQCSGSSPSCNCFAVPGCTGDTQTTCSGTPTEDCDAFGSDFPACESHGCKVGEEGCYGPQCSDLNNSAACSQLAGCKVASASVTCTGSLSPCSGLSNALCPGRPGCHLEVTP
jgi:hypothetical protein